MVATRTTVVAGTTAAPLSLDTLHELDHRLTKTTRMTSLRINYPGSVYILSNPTMPGLLKIGRTANTAAARAKQLYTTGVAAPFVVKHEVPTTNDRFLEGIMHDLLVHLRPIKRREFFELELSFAIELLDLASLLVEAMYK